MSEAVEIRAERVASTFGQTPLAVAVTTVNAGLMAMVMKAPGWDAPHLAWFAAMVAIGLLRLGLWHAYRRRAVTAEQRARWGAASAGSAALAGGAWGLGVILLWPAAEAGQLFWAFVLCGMCAGAAALHAAHPATALAFILPAAIPVLIGFASTASDRGLAAAAMGLVFILALAVTAFRSARLFGAYVSARFDLARQAAALDTANASLREQVARLRATEASLRQAQKMEAVGQLTGGIVHDFNNLLTALLGSLALLQARLPALEQRTQRLLDNARQAAERGAALTQRLLAFGRHQALAPAAIDLPALIGGMSDLLRGSLGGAIRVETRFPPDLPPAQADANQLELAVLNLALNARDAMPLGGTITIAAEERGVGPGEEPGLATGAYVVLSLADTGTGMDAEILARAVEPFFTTKEAGKGTGLGLAMVHGMATQAGGRLSLDSRPGHGTVASLWLPRARRGAAASAPQHDAATRGAALRGSTVLVVDDDALVLTSARDMLEDLGCAVLSAGSGEDALALLRDGARPTLLLADYAMAGMDGRQLAAEAHGLLPGLPVLIMTGRAEAPGLADATRLLPKPFNAATLARALTELLARDQAATR